ncbi:MAG: AmmeMemoRadiSam system protein B [Acidobacteriota bacterium]
MVRRPAFSGSFYPRDPGALRHDVEAHLAAAEGEPTRVAALMAPHAGYLYSGGVAGRTYGSALLPRRLVVLCPNHTGRGASMALYDSGEWETPLGPVPVDEDLARRLKEACPLLEADAEAHRREHAIEVQLPLLQVRVPDLRIVPICVGSSRRSDLRALGKAIATVVSSLEEPMATVISSDMTHYETREFAERQDRMAIEALERVDASELYELVARERISMCGVFPAVAALQTCQDIGARRGTLVAYSTSGDVTGDFSNVVAYAGMHFR